VRTGDHENRFSVFDIEVADVSEKDLLGRCDRKELSSPLLSTPIDTLICIF